MSYIVITRFNELRGVLNVKIPLTLSWGYLNINSWRSVSGKIVLATAQDGPHGMQAR